MTTATTPAREEVRLAPSAGGLVWLAVFAVLCLSNWRFVLVNADGDPALHWRIGNWMIEHRAIIRTEQFSHTRPGAALISKEWLSEVTFAAVGNLAGWNGFVVLAAALVASTAWLLHRQLRRERVAPVIALLLVVVAALAMSHHWLARPHLFTHLFAMLTIALVRDFRGGYIGAGRLFATLVSLAAAWANLHGAFLVGPLLVATYALGAGIEAQRPGRARRQPTHPVALKTTRGTTPLQEGMTASSIPSREGCPERQRGAGWVPCMLLFLAMLAATLLNPNGWRLHAQILDFLRSPTVANYANEFRSPDFHSGGMHGFLLLLLLLVLVLVVLRPRLRATDLVPLAAWGFLALHTVRNIPIFVLVATPVLGEHLTAWWRTRQPATDIAFPPPRRERSTVAIVLALAVGALLVIPRPSTGLPVIRTTLLPHRFPIAATKFIRAHPGQFRGNLLNAYGWGGYLLLELPEHKVFVDGRNDFYGDAFMAEFAAVDKVQPNWRAVLDRYAVTWTLLPPTHPLHAVLALSAGWERVYADDTAHIWVRR